MASYILCICIPANIRSLLEGGVEKKEDDDGLKMKLLVLDRG